MVSRTQFKLGARPESALNTSKNAVDIYGSRLTITLRAHRSRWPFTQLTTLLGMWNGDGHPTLDHLRLLPAADPRGALAHP